MQPNSNTPAELSATELLLMPDGTILVHNLTPAFASLLGELSPEDTQIAPRARPQARHAHEQLPD